MPSASNPFSHLRRAAILLLILGTAAMGLAQEAARRALDLMAQARLESGVPALSLAVLSRGKVVFSEGVGLANLEHEAPATGATVYRVASISKAISAVGLMQLVERGLVSLDDPIQKYVPEFPTKPEGAITLRHLLTHTSGIRHYANDAEMYEMRAFPNLQEALALFKEDPLKHKPGQAFLYSTYGFNLLQGVLEKAGAQALERDGATVKEHLLERYLRRYVWDPSGMTATGLESHTRLIRHRADGYRRDAKGALTRAPYTDVSLKYVGGGFLSTAEDLVRLCGALDQGRLLGEAARRDMQRIHFPQERGRGRGLGWAVATDAAGRLQVSHSGGAVGFLSMLIHYPEQGLAVAAISNGDWFSPAPLAQRVAEAFLMETETPKASLKR